MDGRYYIRFRGRRLGPLTIEKLHSLARRGRFGRHYEVSTDGKNWISAAEYPELFPDSDEGSEGLEGEMESFGETNAWDPIVDANPRAGGRKRKKSRSPGNETNIPTPSYEDPFAVDPKPAGRRKRSRPLPIEPDDGGADSLPGDNPPVLGAPEDYPPRDGDIPLKTASSGGRGRAPQRNRRSIDTPLPVPLEDETDVVLPGHPRQAEGGAKETDDDHDHSLDEFEDEGNEEKKKKSGFFSLFRRKSKQEEELSPHLKTLHEISDRLRKEKFDLDQIIFLGSQQQELSVAGHEDSGDGIQTLGMLTMIAYQTRSSDIHLEAKPGGVDARIRVDGMLVPIVTLPKEVAGRVSGVVKVLCSIDFGGVHKIQEGNYSSIAPGRRTDYRVSFTPSVHGQKLAIRVLDFASSLKSVNDLGAPQKLIDKLQNVMKQDAGMILMCGPTGSGKTTTLYSLIRGIDLKKRNVMTIEDPVEYQIEGVTQSSVDADHGKNFSDMLRALLRQDPDVLLLGEIRDAETAKISMQATMTGHLVLSTVHAQDTLNTVFRLLDLGADPNMVASSLDLVLAQRLVRVLCRQCATRRRPNAIELKRLGKLAPDMLYEPGGCQQCLGTGYSGRRALFELLTTNSRLKELILKSPTLQQLQESVRGTGFVTLRHHGYQLVSQGVTTFSEVDRVIGVS